MVHHCTWFTYYNDNKTQEWTKIKERSEKTAAIVPITTTTTAISSTTTATFIKMEIHGTTTTTNSTKDDYDDNEDVISKTKSTIDKFMNHGRFNYDLNKINKINYYGTYDTTTTMNSKKKTLMMSIITLFSKIVMD